MYFWYLEVLCLAKKHKFPCKFKEFYAFFFILAFKMLVKLP